MVTGKPVVSKRVMGPMPERPAHSPDHVSSTPMPRGVSSPRPVTTTRWVIAGVAPVHERPSAALSVGLACSRTTQYAPRARPPSALHLAIPEQASYYDERRGPQLEFLVDVFNGLLNGQDLLGVLVRNLDPELLFEGHDQLDGVERVRAEVLDEIGFRRHVFFVESQLLGDNLFDAFISTHTVSHLLLSCHVPRATVSSHPHAAVSQ